MSYISIPEAPLARFLFSNTKMSWFWLLVRIYVGWQWLEAGWAKLFNPAWLGADAGKALGGFVKGALAKTAGAHPDVTGWYAWFLEHTVGNHAIIWSYVVTYGELLVGVALIVGFLTGVAAFFGLFMNFNYLLAGTVSSNPILFILGVGIMFAWRVAGRYGVDGWLLPKLGTPWGRDRS